MQGTIRLLGLLLAVIGAAVISMSAAAARSQAELEQLVLGSRHLGAHGLGYNEDSLRELSLTLKPADISGLISLLDQTKLRVGVQFALASQCDAAIQPVQAATTNDQLSALEAEDIMDLIAGFKGCSPDAEAKARDARVEIETAGKERQAQKQKETQAKAADDARVQKNAFKMVDPEQRKTLTRAEREEVFRRSIKAAGLENPQTPAQKAMVERMYRILVLDEPPVSANQ